MLAQGVIEPARSPWASNIVLVRKKDGSFRCCIDYRKLNLVTRKDAYPLPRIDACLDAMASAQWFSTFDLRSSYHQVTVASEDCDKTAFICPRGMYRFRTMPFGLCNAGATFQRLMDIVMTGLHMDICLVYLDDIIVYSNSMETHLNRLVTVLERLRSAGLKLKPEKCALFQKSVSFLGHVVSDTGIGTDPQKIKAVVEWPTPTCIKDVRSFLGLAGYYRRFVKDFATIASPLNEVTKKSAFNWNEREQKAFEKLKYLLTTPPILAMPTDDDEFTIDTDASDYAIGAVLSQKQNGVERVIAYASRALDRRERNYCVTRKELLAVVNFLRFFKQYLLGRCFRIRTDHAALSWLKHTPDPIGQQARWLEQMEEFDYIIEHRPGKSHGNADALSRIVCPKRDCVCRNENRLQEAFQSRAVADTIAINSRPADHSHVNQASEFQRHLESESEFVVKDILNLSTNNQVNNTHCRYARRKNIVSLNCDTGADIVESNNGDDSTAMPSGNLVLT
jgi:RNase H-like domain found in reverse transcriptase/Reverse transcriptase (RNA-dependent DNA polymerase)